jgi:glycosyltransferase involved in cell wall biosynthesis
MSEFSIVCCISKPDVFDECLLTSAKEVGKGHDWEIVPIHNDNNIYSASGALNVGIDASKSDIVIFAHQDIRLLDNWFEILQNLINQMPDDWGILGCAGIGADFGRKDIGAWGGAVEGSTVAVGSVWESDESLPEPPYWDGIKDLTRIHCADECLFVLNKKTGLRFDNQFTGFHFYGVDICLQARAAAWGCYGAHLPVVHYGKYSASVVGDKKYWTFLRFLHNKWKLRFPEMLGTHMHWAPDELTSYISLGLSSGAMKMDMKAMGIKKARFSTDKLQHFIEDEI